MTLGCLSKGNDMDEVCMYLRVYLSVLLWLCAFCPPCSIGISVTVFDPASRGNRYYDYYAELAMDSGNCGTVYEAVGRLKLYQFSPPNVPASTRLYLASELAQLAIRERCTLHHWPLQSTTPEHVRRATTLSLLVPDVLVELDETAQLQNIHRIYLADQDTTLDENAQVIRNGSSTSGKDTQPVVRSRTGANAKVRLSRK